MNQNQKDNSWWTFGWMACVSFWVLYAVFCWTWIGAGFVCFVLALYYVINRRMKAQEFYMNRNDLSDHYDVPFFIRGQIRRRKLDLTRSSNVLKDSIGEKLKRQLLRVKRRKK